MRFTLYPICGLALKLNGVAGRDPDLFRRGAFMSDQGHLHHFGDQEAFQGQFSQFLHFLVLYQTLSWLICCRPLLDSIMGPSCRHFQVKHKPSDGSLQWPSGHSAVQWPDTWPPHFPSLHRQDGVLSIAKGHDPRIAFFTLKFRLSCMTSNFRTSVPALFFGRGLSGRLWFSAWKAKLLGTPAATVGELAKSCRELGWARGSCRAHVGLMSRRTLEWA